MRAAILRWLFLYVPLLLMPVIFIVYGFELNLWRELDSRRRDAAVQGGYRVDPRDKNEFIATRKGAAVAYVPPEALFRWRNDVLRSVLAGDTPMRDLFTLGGVSRADNVVCNDAGPWFHYVADRHGFNNPDAAWDRPHLDIVALGDSSTLGNCVPQGRAMIDLLRKSYPATLNLGAGGNGPLFMLGALREYGARFRPRFVLWDFCDNDLGNLARERDSPVLRAYLVDAAFSQQLGDRQAEIDRRLTALANRVGGHGGWRDLYAVRVLRLQQLRARLAQPVPWTAADAAALGPLFHDVLDRAKQAITAWGGRLVVVYLPPPGRYFDPLPVWLHSVERRKALVLNTARRLDIAVIDLQKAFDRVPDPKSLAFGPATHYSEVGYSIAAKALIDGMQQLQGN